MFCSTSRGRLHWSKLNFLYCLSLLSISISVVTFKGVLSTAPRRAEVFPTSTQCLRDGCESTDTTFTYPSNLVGVRLSGADLRLGRKHPTPLHILSLWSCSLHRDLGWAHTEQAHRVDGSSPKFQCLQHRHKRVRPTEECSMQPSFLTWTDQIQVPEPRLVCGSEKTPPAQHLFQN